MSAQSIYTKTTKNFQDTSSLIYEELAERSIIKDEYLPNYKDVCFYDYFHIKKLTYLLTHPNEKICEKREYIKELLNNYQLKYKKLNQFKK